MSSFDKNTIKRESVELGNYSFKTVEQKGTSLHPEHAALVAFFDTRTNGTRLARRSDFRPEELVAFLERMSLVEPVLDADGTLVDARFRLMGSAIATAYGEMTGRLGSEYSNPEVVVRFFEGMNLALKHRTTIIGHAKGRNSDGIAATSPAPDANVLFLPLEDDDGQITQVLLHTTLE